MLVDYKLVNAGTRSYIKIGQTWRFIEVKDKISILSLTRTTHNFVLFTNDVQDLP